MCRPERHNAFNPSLISELTHVFQQIQHDDNLRVIILSGEGPSFSAGADLDWMALMGQADEATNLASAKSMASLFHAIHTCPKPVVARVQGAALGGGSGLVCSTDLAICSPQALFGFTEVRLGLVAGVISPFVLRRIGASQARAKMLTGERFRAEEAFRIGLVHQVADNLDEAVEQTIDHLLQGSPQAHQRTKELLSTIDNLSYTDQIEPTAQAIASARSSKDGREGLDAFLHKRPPCWAYRYTQKN